MAKVIIGIHGLANKSPKVILGNWWKDSILEGLKNRGHKSPTFRYEMVYWANFLYKNLLHQDDNYSFDDYFNQEPYFKAKRGSLKVYKDGWRDYLRQKSPKHFRWSH